MAESEARDWVEDLHWQAGSMRFWEKEIHVWVGSMRF